jgi:hypothetical protein
VSGGPLPHTTPDLGSSTSVGCWQAGHSKVMGDGRAEV